MSSSDIHILTNDVANQPESECENPDPISVGHKKKSVCTQGLLTATKFRHTHYSYDREKIQSVRVGSKEPKVLKTQPRNPMAFLLFLPNKRLNY